MDEFRSAPPHPAAKAAQASPGRASVVAAASAGVLPSQDTLRANLADFALAELVRQHRTSFAPPWTIESWAKLLIWLALNSGCAGDTASLEAFAAALGPERSGRLRRLFFSREFDASGLRLLADPADGQVLVEGGLSAVADRTDQESELDPVAAALDAVGLAALVVPDRQRWQRRDGGVVIPFSALSPCG
jgi:hypothetical protein